MKHFHAMAALVRLELSTRAPILAAALLVGVATIPLAAATRQQTVVFAVALAASFCLAAAGLLGANMLAEPIAQGRAGFFFGQPLAAGALWWGRLLGAAIVAIGTAVAVLAPAWLWRATRLAPSEREALTLWALALLATLPLAAIGHTIATLVRVRSARAALDLTAILVIAALAGWSARTLKDAALDARFAWAVPVALAPLLAIAAGHAQLLRGRGEAERGHVALSTTLWAPLLLVAFGLAGFTAWTLDLEPSDVDAPPHHMAVATDGSRWVAFGGTVQSSDLLSRARTGLHATFLVDVGTGDWARLGQPVHWDKHRRSPATTPTLAKNGSRVAWLSRDGTAFWSDLTRSSVRSLGTARELELGSHALPPDFSDASSWAFSPNGKLLAAVLTGPRSVSRGNGLDRDLRTLHVVELPSGTPVFSAALPWPSHTPDPHDPSDPGRDPISVNLRWLDDERLELAGCLWPRARFRPDAVTHAVNRAYGLHAGFAELELGSREGGRFTEVRSFAEPACGRLRVSRDGRLATYTPEWFQRENSGSGLRDTHGGPPVVLDVPERRVMSATLGDEWVAQVSALDVLTFYPPDLRLRWFNRTGELLGELPLADSGHATFGGEISGRLPIVVSAPLDAAAVARGVQRQRLLLFDPHAGTLEPLEAPSVPRHITLWPVAEGIGSFPRHGPAWLPTPDSLEARLLQGDDGSLVLLDLEPGELRVVLGPPGS